MASPRSVATVPTNFGAARARSMSCLYEMESFAPWICLLDAFYYHSDGLERPSIASGRVGEFLVSYRPLGTRINLAQRFEEPVRGCLRQLLAHLSFLQRYLACKLARARCKLRRQSLTHSLRTHSSITRRGGGHD